MIPRMIRFTALLTALFCCSGDVYPAVSPEGRTFSVGFFEAGEYTGHNQFRVLLREELERLTPQEFQIVFKPSGYRSAGWNRDASRRMALEMARDTSLDVIVAVGPWVVRDLLAAGCKTPILAAYQFDAASDSLVGADRRPIAPNLTFAMAPDRFRSDLRTIHHLLGAKKIGFIYFRDSDAATPLLDSLKQIGDSLGVTIESAAGYNNFGTFAFFKAYGAIAKKVDAIYVGPLWGLDGPAVQEFLDEAVRSRMPICSGWESFVAGRGACLSTAEVTPLAEARFQAGKLIRILKGERPADLPVVLERSGVLTINAGALRACRISIDDNILAEANLIDAPIDPSASSYRLQEAIARAFEQNPGFLAQSDALTATVKQSERAAAAYWPQVTLSGRVAHVDDRTVNNHLGQVSAEQYGLSLNVYQTLFSLPAIRAMKDARLVRDSLQADSSAARQAFAEAVTLAFLNCLKADDLVTLMRTERAGVDRNLQLARARAALGEETTLDWRRWEAARLRSSADLVAAEQNRQVARILLNVLLNQPGEQPLLLRGEPFGPNGLVADYFSLSRFVSNDSVFARTREFLVADGIRMNPATRREDVVLESRKASLMANSARWLPTFGLGARLALADSLADRPPSFDEKRPTFEVGLHMSWTLLDGFDRRKERARYRSLVSRQEYLRDAQRLELMGQIQVLSATLRSQLQQAQLCDRAATLAAESQDSILAGYSSGVLGYSDVDEQALRLTAYEVAALTARYQLFETEARLLRALGWMPEDRYISPGAELARRLVARFGQPTP